MPVEPRSYVVAKPLRFRYSPAAWSADRVRRQLFDDLQANIGARAVGPWYAIAGNWETHRFEMANGDLALFARCGERAYWMGNTETPEALWRTEKVGWEAVPYQVARWAQRELLSTLTEETPWLGAFPHLSWFFLPVFMSKDGRESTRAFFRDHAAGFPDAEWRAAARFFESGLESGALDPYREVMAGKLGTSPRVDRVRMSAAMAEFITAKLLVEAGYTITPEIEVATGHSLDFRAQKNRTNRLIEVTRPQVPARRAAAGPVAAVRDTVATKVDGQLAAHGGGATLFVDCSSFVERDWQTVRERKPDMSHRPAVVFRARPDGFVEGYGLGAVGVDLDGVLAKIP
jgi:hypothetical protein